VTQREDGARGASSTKNASTMVPVGIELRPSAMVHDRPNDPRSEAWHDPISDSSRVLPFSHADEARAGEIVEYRETAIDVARTRSRGKARPCSATVRR